MVGIVIVGHGTYPEGLCDAIGLLVGKQEHMLSLGLLHGDDPEQFESKIQSMIRAVDVGDGVLVLVDLLGGTPSNAMMRLLPKSKVQAIAGVNLPMALQAVLERGEMELDDLVRSVREAGADSLVDLREQLRQLETARRPEIPADDAVGGGDADSKGEVVLCRVDDRLIHGQVMTSWLNATGANKIMIVDDETAANAFLKTVFKSAVPSNVGLGMFNEAKAADRLVKGFRPSDRVIVLAKYPQTFLNLMERGAHIPQLIIGGMGAREHRTKLYRNISASKEERDALRRIMAAGTPVYIQILADDSKVSVQKLLQQSG